MEVREVKRPQDWLDLVDQQEIQLLELAQRQQRELGHLAAEICARLRGREHDKVEDGVMAIRLDSKNTKQPLLNEQVDSVPPSPSGPRPTSALDSPQMQGSLLSYAGVEDDAASEVSDAGSLFTVELPRQASAASANSQGKPSGTPTPTSPQLRTGKTMENFLSERSNSSRGQTETQERIRFALDYMAGVVVVLNSCTMLLEFELEGNANGEKLGMTSNSSGTWNDSETIFRVFDVSFVIFFFFEWLVRLWLERLKFALDFANWFDTLCMISGFVDLILRVALQDSSEASRSVVILRLMRALKSLRAIRMVRSLRFFRGLRVLVRACQCFLPSLCWSMVLLGVFMTMGALMMGNLLQAFILDEELSDDDRKWLWTRFGTAYRATYTLFEITFAGNWPTSVRPVLEKASHVFVIFFVIYVTVVVFAVIRVISAVFLKDTFDAAQNDAEQLVIDKLRLKSQYIAKLERIFRAIDAHGDGVVTEDRLMQILANPKVAAYFQTLDLDVHEGRALFHLLDNGDGEVTLDEFIDGIMRCKGAARAIDQVAMHADLKQLNRRVAKLHREIKKSSDMHHRASDEHGKVQAGHLKVFRNADASMSLGLGLGL